MDNFNKKIELGKNRSVEYKIDEESYISINTI